MTADELKSYVIGMIGDDFMASQFHTTGQYRSALMRKVQNIDLDYEFENVACECCENRCEVATSHLHDDGYWICKKCMDEFKRSSEKKDKDTSGIK